MSAVPVRHLVLVGFKSTTTAETIASLANFKAQIPDVLYYNVYPLIPADKVPAGHQTHPMAYTHVLDSLFPSIESYHVYDKHPDHLALQKQLFPYVEDGAFMSVDVLMPQLDTAAFVAMQRGPHVHHLTLIKPNKDVQRTQLDPMLQRWGALPAVVPELVWSHVAYAADRPVYEGWADRSHGYRVVSDMLVRDLQSTVGYTQNAKHQELAPLVMGVTDVMQGGLIAADWQL